MKFLSLLLSLAKNLFCKSGGVSMRQPRQKLSSTTLGLNKHRTAVKINKHKKTRISKVPRSNSDNFYGVKISKYKQL